MKRDVYPFTEPSTYEMEHPIYHKCHYHQLRKTEYIINIAQ